MAFFSNWSRIQWPDLLTDPEHSGQIYLLIQNTMAFFTNWSRTPWPSLLTDPEHIGQIYLLIQNTVAFDTNWFTIISPTQSTIGQVSWTMQFRNKFGNVFIFLCKKWSQRIYPSWLKFFPSFYSTVLPKSWLYLCSYAGGDHFEDDS